MTDVFPIFCRLGLGSLALRQKSQSTTEASFSLFSLFHVLDFLFLSLWTVDDHGPQLLISQYTCASIRRRANTRAHSQKPNSTSIFLKIDLAAQKQTKGWRNILQHDSASLERLHADSSLMLQMYFQFESNQKDLLFFPPDTIIMSCGSTCESQRRRGREEDKQESKQEPCLIFNSPLKPNLPQQGIVLCQQGSIAATSMNMSWTISSTLLAIWRQEEPWAPQ